MKTSLLKSRYAIPVGVALAFHAFLLFGFSPVPHPKIDRPPPEKTRPFVLPPDVEIVALETEEQKPAAKAVEAPPELPDWARPNTNPTTITVPAEPPSTIGPKFSLDHVPEDYGAPGVNGIVPTVFDPNALDEPPRERFQSRPDYPFDLRARGVSGEVWVEFVVDVRGDVISAHVVRATDARFEPGTVHAVKNWKFQPGLHHGIPVSFRMVVPVKFSVDGS